MTGTGDAERAAAHGARRALAALGHELASPLTALQTYLRLAKGDELAPIARCAERIRAIAELARELSQLEDTTPAVSDIGLAVESAAARVSVAVELAVTGDVRAPIAPGRASTIATALLRGVLHTAVTPRIVARVERRGDRICARLDPGIEPTEWRVVEPWRSGTGVKLELWAAAVAAGEHGIVRLGTVDGQLAAELELPAAESR